LAEEPPTVATSWLGLLPPLVLLCEAEACLWTRHGFGFGDDPFGPLQNIEKKKGEQNKE
jgi:hypothetical protein